MTDTVIPFPGKLVKRRCAVTAFIHENDEAYTLQFDMMADFGVSLTVWKNGAAPSVLIFIGDGECPFETCAGRGLFPEFAEFATGNRVRRK
jgi:hypothetical protein